MYLSRGRVAVGCVKRWEMSCVCRRNFLWSMEHSRRYRVQSKKKWCTVLMVFSSQLGQWGESKHLIRWRCLFNPMCPVWSCMMMEVCLRNSGLMSFIHFFDRTDLSIPLMWRQHGEVFQQCAQRRWILDFDSWCSVDKLAGRGFLKSAGRSFRGLELPVAASLASLLALSFGAKSRCPGTQCICKSIIPFDFAVHCWFRCWACRNRSLCWIRSWRWWSLPAMSCMASSR